MNRKTICFALGLCAGLLAACNSNNDHPNSSLPPVPIPQTLDTQKVLALAKQSSETASPFAINGGLVTLSDTSETSSPVAVDAM